MRLTTLSKWIITLSFLVAIFLTIIPLPNWAVWFRPLWILLVLIYWTLALEDKVSVGIAWVLGILLDTLQGTIFGEHAFVLCCCVYIVSKLRRKLRLFPLGQQAVVVFGLSLFYQLMIFIIQSLISQPILSIWFWLSMFTTALIWPWVFILLRDLRRRFKVT